MRAENVILYGLRTENNLPGSKMQVENERNQVIISAFGGVKNTRD